MPDHETGHEHQQPRSAVLTLSTPMLATLDETRRRDLVAALVDLAGRREDEDSLGDRLAHTLASLGIEQPAPVVDRMVENLRAAQDLTIVTDSGEVLYGDAGFDISRQDPGVHGTEDPEHGDRPVYS